jgi:drug/metabolite transporter (DMT)-like permease
MASLWMLFASFAFAAMGAAVKLASAYYSTSEIVMYRGLVGTLMLLFLVRLQRGTLRTAFPKEHLWRGMVGVVSLWLWFSAISRLPLAAAVTLNYMSPIWTAAFLVCAGWWHGKKRAEWPLTGAIVLSFAGVTLVVRPAFEAQQWAGAAMALGSGMLAALAYLLVRRLSRMGEPEYRVVFYFSLMNVVAGLLGSALPASTPDGANWHAHGWRGAALLLAVGVAGTGAQLALTRAYRTGKTLVVANLQYTGIIFSSAWGILLWGDLFDWPVWIGIGVILASGLAATFYNMRTTVQAAAAGAPVTP